MPLKNKLPKFILAAAFVLFLPLVSAYSQSVIAIESADTTEYKKNTQTGEDEIILSGNVSISVTSGSSKTTITASLVTFNRVTDMLYAQGNVALVQTGGAQGNQNITAASLLFNTSTLEGVFDNGRVIQTQSDAINLPSGSTLVVASDMFGRGASNTIAFKNGELTFCDDENPHWKIRATDIWLLPGGEFAFFNAVMYVGQLPVFYLPAFYYPKDELIFNPSIGYNQRTGYFVQTTTYLIGRKGLESSSSSSSSSSDDVSKALFNFMRPSSLKEQKREGLVLHNLDEEYSGDTSTYLKVMADYYSTLGAMAGVEAAFKPGKILTSISGNLNVGFSNTIFYNSSTGAYIPYSPSGQIYYDHSNFMGISLPFRYSANLAVSFGKPFSISISMPIYSDPYFTQDFGDRSEFMDWIGFLMSNSDDTTSSSSSVSSFTWAANASYSVSLPAWIKPYISTLSISSINSSIVFSSKSASFSTDYLKERFGDYYSDSSSWKNNSPERYFYYPSQINPVKVTGKINGTLVSISSTKKKTTYKSPSFPVPLTVPEEFQEAKKEDNKENISGEKTDGGNGKESGGNKSSEENKKEETAAAEEVEPVLAESALPVLTVPSALTASTKFNGINYTLTYSVSPSLTTQFTYSSTALSQPEDFNWTNFQSTYYQVKVPVTMTSNFSYRDTFISMKNTASFNPVFQAHPYLNDSYTDSSKTSILKTDYNAKKLDLTETNAVSFRPFIYSSYFKNTGLDWNTTLKVIRTTFLGDVDNPEWQYKAIDLTDDECVTVHTLSAILSAVETTNFSQVLTLSTTLPPQTDEYNGTLALTFPFISMSFASGITRETDSDDWKISPFKQSVSASLLNKKLKLTESFNYNIQDNYAEGLKFSASYETFSLAFTMSYTYGYVMNYNEVSGKPTGWSAKSEKEFLPSSASFSYTTPSNTWRWWKNRITFTPSISTSIVYDCLRPTNSYFRFAPSVTFNINEFAKLTFSSESKNSVIYRYIQNYIGSEFKIGGETNPFIDLIDSFAFWGDGCFIDPNQTLRKNSGFKLKSLSVTLEHDLHDWDLAASFSVKPRLTTTGSVKSYDFSPYFAFSVTWRPMSSLKTKIVDEYGEWELNPE